MHRRLKPTTGPAAPTGAMKRTPANPFLEPTAANSDLGFLKVDDALLAYAVEHREELRRRREGLLLDFMKRKDRGAEAWDALVAAAAEPFVPQPWMLPVRELESPGIIKGIYDYIPIRETAPEIYDPESRRIMSENRQKPWMIFVAMNARWHSREAFICWVNTHMVPEIVKSARTLAMAHFEPSPSPTPAGPGAARGSPRRSRRGIRPPSGTMAKPGPVLSVKLLRERLLALACYHIRFSAAPGESMTRTLDRYQQALPAEIVDKVNLAMFAGRIEHVARDSRNEWLVRLGDARRYRGAVDAGLLHIAACQAP